MASVSSRDTAVKHAVADVAKKHNVQGGVVKYACLAIVAVVFGVIGQTMSLPMPKKLSGGTFYQRLDARASFWWQCFQHITGFRKEYDVASLQAKYELLLPNETTREDYRGVYPELQLLPELDAMNDPNWLSKFNKTYRNTLTPATPLVIRGLFHADTEHFPGMKDWDLDYLRDHVYKTREIPVFTNCTNDKSVIFMPFDKFVDEMKDTSKERYARCVSDYDEILGKGLNTQHIAAMEGKGIEHKISKAIEGRDTQCVFIGGKHVHSRLHCDLGVSAFFQIEGRKRWVFFPPTETPLLFPKGHRYNVAYNADLDIFNPDLKDKYLLGLATGYEVVLNPGDVLFFPAFWWHAVQNLDEVTVGIDFAFVDFVSSWLVNSMLVSGTLLNGNTLREFVVNALFNEDGNIKDIFFDGYRIDKP